MRGLVGLVAALVLWSAMAWVWVQISGNAHVCSIVGAQTTDANGQTPALTQAEMDELVRERCGPRASVADLMVFAAGYIVILGVVAVRAERPSVGTRDDLPGRDG
jgi:hypothetical protein